MLSFDAASGKTKGEPVELYRAKTDRGGGWAIGRAVWSPDGKALAFVLEESGWDKIYEIPVTGGTPKQITTGEWDDDAPVFSRDGKWMAVVSNQRSREERSIRLIPRESNRGSSAERQIVASNAPGFDTNPQWSPDGTKLYFVHSSPLETPNLMVASTSSQAGVRYLSHTLPLNFSKAGFRLPERVSYKSKDELEISAMLYKPVDFKQFAAAVSQLGLYWLVLNEGPPPTGE